MIWCVEDDASIRDIEVYALQSTGLVAKGFEDGDCFLSALKTELPDLVILDVMLPGTDGIEVLKILKSTAEYVDIPVIMATAKGAEFDKVQGLPLSVFDGDSHGEVMSRFTNDIDNIDMMLNHTVINMISGVITLTGTFVMMVTTNIWLTLITVCFVPLFIRLGGFIGV